MAMQDPIHWEHIHQIHRVWMSWQWPKEERKAASHRVTSWKRLATREWFPRRYMHNQIYSTAAPVGLMLEQPGLATQAWRSWTLWTRMNTFCKTYKNSRRARVATQAGTKEVQQITIDTRWPTFSHRRARLHWAVVSCNRVQKTIKIFQFQLALSICTRRSNRKTQTVGWGAQSPGKTQTSNNGQGLLSMTRISCFTVLSEIFKILIKKS